jgi:hypothetical protein
MQEFTQWNAGLARGEVSQSLIDSRQYRRDRPRFIRLHR